MLEKYIKNQLEETINKIKKECIRQGFELTEENENFWRIGVQYGFSLSSMMLANIPHNITIE